MRCTVFLMAFLLGIVKNAAERGISMRAKSLRACFARGIGRAGARPVSDTLLSTMKKAWNARIAGGGEAHETDEKFHS